MADEGKESSQGLPGDSKEPKGKRSFVPRWRKNTAESEPPPANSAPGVHPNLQQKQESPVKKFQPRWRQRAAELAALEQAHQQVETPVQESAQAEAPNQRPGQAAFVPRWRRIAAAQAESAAPIEAREPEKTQAKRFQPRWRRASATPIATESSVGAETQAQEPPKKAGFVPRWRRTAAEVPPAETVPPSIEEAVTSAEAVTEAEVVSSVEIDSVALAPAVELPAEVEPVVLAGAADDQDMAVMLEGVATEEENAGFEFILEEAEVQPLEALPLELESEPLASVATPLGLAAPTLLAAALPFEPEDLPELESPLVSKSPGLAESYLEMEPVAQVELPPLKPQATRLPRPSAPPPPTGIAIPGLVLPARPNSRPEPGPVSSPPPQRVAPPTPPPQQPVAQPQAPAPSRVVARSAPPPPPKKEILKKRRRFLASSEPGIPTETVATFTRQLSVMLGSGLPLLQALTFFAESSTGRLAEVVDELATKVSSGFRLSAAMGQCPGVFNEVYVGLIELGETTSHLDEALEKLSDLLEKQVRLAKRLSSAMIYPAFLVAVCLASIAIFLEYVLPTMVPLFSSFNMELPLPTKLLLMSSHLVWPSVFGVIALGLTWIWFKPVWNKARRERARWARNIDRFVLRIPGVGKFALQLATARVLFALATMLETGLPLLNALKRCEGVAANLEVAHRLEKAGLDLREGSTVVDALRVHNVLPSACIHLLSAGEETAQLAEMVAYSARFYEEEVDHSITQFMNLIEPFIMIVMGVVVGFIVLAAVLPTVEMINHLG